jgi:hypothetical protein
MNVEWVEPLFLLDDESKAKYHPARQSEMLPVVRTSEVITFLQRVASDTVCDGPGCLWCETGDDHPLSALGRAAKDLLGED